MTVVNMLDAKSNLSRLVEAVESGAEAEIVIARNGRPAARLVPIEPANKGQRIGVAKGKFVAPERFAVSVASVVKWAQRKRATGSAAASRQLSPATAAATTRSRKSNE